MVTYRGDMAYSSVKNYVHHTFVYVRAYVCIKSKIILLISQGYYRA